VERQAFVYRHAHSRTDSTAAIAAPTSPQSRRAKCYIPDLAWPAFTRHRLIAPALPVLSLGGCAAVPFERASSLTSYDSLTSNNGRMTKADYRVTPTDLVSARTICGSRRSRYHHPHRADQYRGGRPVDGNVARSELRRSGARPEAASRAWRSFRRGRGSHGDGKQVGAMVWAKGANFVTTNARVSQIGDAYSVSANFCAPSEARCSQA
jgi:hypothetical protein